MPRKKPNKLTDEKLIELFKIPSSPERSYTTMRNFHQQGYKSGKNWTTVRSKLVDNKTRARHKG